MRKMFLLALLLVSLITFRALADVPSFGSLDALGRATSAVAILSPDALDQGKRGSISDFQPSGFIQAEYDFIEGHYLYNRCHLIGAQLAPGTEVRENLFTGTRQLNVAMIPVENHIARYLREFGGRVIYHVTPDFHGEELVCRGISMEVFDIDGESPRLSYYLENVEDGVTIDYASGASMPTGEGPVAGWYVVNLGKKRFHSPDCPGIADISEHNRQGFYGNRDALIADGLRPCGLCHP